MKKLITLSLFLFFAIALIMDGKIQASETYATCGVKPGFLANLLTDAEKIRVKCIEDIYEQNKEQTRIEVEELDHTIGQLGTEVKKVALKNEYNMVQCDPRNGEPKRDPKLSARCHELVRTRNALISRMDELLGWSERPRPKPRPDGKVSASELTPPCPSKEKLKEMQTARIFNRKLFQTYERCVTLNPENDY